MPNNHKKEFPESGLEQDCTSKWARQIYCYVKNIRGIKTFVKQKLNRRFRKFNKNITNFE